MKEVRILFVDDDAIPQRKGPYTDYMWYYLQAVRDEGFAVEAATGVDEAFSLLESKAESYSLLIVDLLMPPGKAFKEEDTRKGLRTGEFLVATVCQRWPRLPIVVLSNVLNLEAMRRLLKSPSVKEVLAKAEHTPFELVEDVKRVLEGK